MDELNVAGELQESAPWPFPGDRFPDDLGAVVHNSILEGRRPALQVVHFDTGTWGIADAIDWPDENNLTATHIWHVIEMDPTIESLATLPPRHQADRQSQDQPWSISPHAPARPGSEVIWRLSGPLRWLFGRLSSRDIHQR